MRFECRIAVPPMRYIVVHYHIFKNGGSTIESILEREFAGRYATLHGPDAGSTLDAGHLIEFLADRPRIEAVASHHLRYPKPVLRNAVFFDCCFLRNPLDRLQSLHAYLRRAAAEDDLSRSAKRENLRTFTTRLLEHSPHVISDVQVTHLARAGAFTRPAAEFDLERASDVLREMAMPGVVDMFDESLVASEYFLKPAFPELRLEYVPQNVSKSLDELGEEPERKSREAWGDELHEELTRLNQMDLELVRRARAEILRRLSLVPRAARRLEEFRGRCAMMRERMAS